MQQLELGIGADGAVRASASPRVCEIQPRKAAAPWVRSASHSFSEFSGREYSSVISTALGTASRRM